ncbi:MAG: tRNA (guanosine(46)-N7)-methyltransferase TrmB [Oscillospiraceae bacterium]|nr:tRNA (guanosine(46)-N7)-methyltransferase TrmB [Oscillospiraceae bacterium]
MRMRKKKWAVPELMASPLYIKEPESFRGKWQQAFEKEQPLYVELGCGKGGYASQFALLHPDVNLLAVDISSNMLGVGRRKIDALFAENGRAPDNIRLTEYNIEHINDVIAPEDDVQRIFINFCNPWPKPRHYKKRLTHPRQLALYKTFLRPGCEVRFKTDDDQLFEHSREYFAENGFEILWETFDLANSGFEGNIKTEHEAMFEAEGIKIKMLIARWPGEKDGE